jgi:PAS domain S-box-containing protein
VSATQDRLTARLAAQQSIVRALAESGDLAEAGRRVLEIVGALLDGAAGVLWEVDERHGLLRPVSDWGSPALDAEPFLTATRAVTLQRGVGLPGRAWESEALQWVRELDADSGYPRATVAHLAGLRSGLAAPVRGDGGVVGVLELAATTTREPGVEATELLESVSSQIGLYVERRRADARVRESRELHEATVAAALDCIITMDAAGAVIEFNPAAEATFGYDREEALGEELADLIIPPELRDAHRGAIERHLRTGEARILGRRMELSAMRRDGSRFPVELTVVRIPGREPPLFTGFVRDISERRRAEAEVERLLAAEQAARRAAEEAERHSAEVATTLQRSLLPPSLPAVPGLRAASAFQASGTYEVGGDFYDLFRTSGGRWAAVIGDVMGKGPAAAAVTGLARHTARAAATHDDDPVSVVRALNRALLEHAADTQVTLAYARLTPGDASVRVDLACAGHPPAMLVRAGGELEEVPATGLLLGALDEPALDPVTTTLEPGDTLLLYTDGVTDIRTPAGLLGPEPLAAALRLAAGAPPEEIVDRLRRATVDGPGHQVRDDVAMLVLQATGVSGPSR